MGLFSSKYVTNVATTVARVIEDHSLPNSIKHGAIKSMFSGDDPIINPVSSYVMEELSQSIGVRAGRMYNFGKGAYSFGLPVGSVQLSAAGQPMVEAIIEAEVGGPIDIEYYHFTAFNNLHIGWMKLVSEHGYDSLTNQLGELTAAKGKPVFLTDMVVVVTEANLSELANGSLAMWGIPAIAGANPLRAEGGISGKLRRATPFEVDPGAAQDYMRVTYAWTDQVQVNVEGVMVTRNVINTDAFQFPISGYDDLADYVQVKYTKVSTGKAGYWLYKAGAGVHADIDNLHNPDYAGNGSYFPWLYFRFNKVSGTADKTTQVFKDSKKLAKYIGLDYEQVTDAIHDNPGIADVEQAMMAMMVPANTTDQLEMRYLFDYFNSLYATTGGQLKPSQAISSIKELLDSSSADSAIVIQDKRFKMSLGFRSIFKKKVVGTLGKIGTLTSGYGSEDLTQTGTTTGSGAPASFTTPVKFHFYRRQISETIYEEIRIINLKLTYFIYEQYNAVGDENDDILMIPVDCSITKHYSMSDRETLYSRALHYIFNSRQITEVKWYQQGWFAALLLVAAIVITIVSYGEAYQTISAALAAGTITIEAVIMYIAIEVVKFVLINIAIKLFVKAVGAKFAFIVAVIAAIAGGYQVIEAGGLKGAPWATELLQTSTSLSKGVSLQVQNDFTDLISEAEAFSADSKAKQKKIDEANKLFQDNSWLIPTIIFGETPNDYYQRTVHSGNIGVLGLDAISSYVDISLTLPKLNETVGEEF